MKSKAMVSEGNAMRCKNIGGAERCGEAKPSCGERGDDSKAGASKGGETAARQGGGATS